MRSGYWLGIVAAAFVAGWATGRGGHRESGKETAEVPVRERAALQRDERGKSAAQWAEELRGRDNDGLKSFGREIPRAELGPAIEKWIASHGVGGLGNEGRARLRILLGDWAERDFEGVRNWADGLGDPVIREMALTALAAALAEKDPERAFECLAANGEFHQDLMGHHSLYELMRKLSADAIAEGPEAFAALWSRLPVGKSSMETASGFDVSLGDDVDFVAYADALRKIREMGRHPIYPGGVMKEWAKRDAEAATEYVLEAGLSGRVHYEWWELGQVIEQERGLREVGGWTVEMLRRVPEERRAEFFLNAGMLGAPERVLGADQEYYQPGEKEALARDMLQGAAKRGWWEWGKILEAVEPERRMEVLLQVRGAESVGDLQSYLEGQGYAAERIEEVIAVVRRPKE